MYLNCDIVATTYEAWVATGAHTELVEKLYRCGCLLIGCTVRNLIVARPESPSIYFPIPYSEPIDENDNDILNDLIEGKVE